MAEQVDQPRRLKRPGLRISVVDSIRGAAIFGVVIFHLIWDLDFSGLIPQGIATHPVWLGYGRLLAGTFMFLVGVSLVLAHPEGVVWRAFLRRVRTIALAAAAITVVTYMAFPGAFVFFGILHAIVIASLSGVLVIYWPVWTLWTLGSVIWMTPFLLSSTFFDSRWTAWIGFSHSAPASNDLVPVFPWLGITIIGIAATRTAIRFDLLKRFQAAPSTGFISGSLRFMGHHSLIIYLLHQPILLAIILPLARWTH